MLKKDELLERAGARILRFTSLKGAVAEAYCADIVAFASRLLHNQPCDYEMLLKAQKQLDAIGGDATLLVDVKKYFLH